MSKYNKNKTYYTIIGNRVASMKVARDTLDGIFTLNNDLDNQIVPYAEDIFTELSAAKTRLMVKRIEDRRNAYIEGEIRRRMHEYTSYLQMKNDEDSKEGEDKLILGVIITLMVAVGLGFLGVAIFVF